MNTQPHTRWINAEARSLLATFGANPPAQRTFPYRFGETDTRYIGAEVTRLRSIWKRECERLLKLADAGEISRDVWRACADYSEQSAIRDAIAAAGGMERAA